MSISLLSHQVKKRRNVFRKRGETWRKCSVCKSSNLFVALTLEMQRHCCCTLLLLVSNLGIGSSVLQLRPPHCVLQCGCLRKCHKRLRTVVGWSHCTALLCIFSSPSVAAGGGPGKWLIGPTYHPESFTCFSPPVSHLSFTAVSHHFHCCLLLDPFPLLLS